MIAGVHISHWALSLQDKTWCYWRTIWGICPCAKFQIFDFAAFLHFDSRHSISIQKIAGIAWMRKTLHPPSLNDSINSSNMNQSGILTFGKFDKGWDWWDWSGGKIYCPLPPRPPNWTRRTHPGSRLAPGLDGNIIWDLESHFTVFSYYWAKIGIFCQPPLLSLLAMHSFVRGGGNDMINENKNSCDIRDQRVKTPLSSCLVVWCCLGHVGSLVWSSFLQ